MPNWLDLCVACGGPIVLAALISGGLSIGSPWGNTPPPLVRVVGWLVPAWTCFMVLLRVGALVDGGLRSSAAWPAPVVYAALAVDGALLLGVLGATVRFVRRWPGGERWLSRMTRVSLVHHVALALLGLGAALVAWQNGGPLLAIAMTLLGVLTVVVLPGLVLLVLLDRAVTAAAVGAADAPNER